MKHYFVKECSFEPMDCFWDALADSLDYDNIIVYGNRHLVTVNEDFRNDIDDFMSSFYDSWEADLKDAEANLFSIAKNEFNNEMLSKEAIKSIIDLAKNWRGTNEDIANYLSYMTDKPWHEVTIRGYSQSDWQTVICPVDYDTDYTEAVYFGRGTVYAICEEATETPPDFEDSGLVFYDFVPDYKNTKEYIAEVIGQGCKPEDVLISTIKDQHTQIVYDYSDFE